jgi:hypothetical protein
MDESPKSCFINWVGEGAGIFTWENPNMEKIAQHKNVLKIFFMINFFVNGKVTQNKF